MNPDPRAGRLLGLSHISPQECYKVMLAIPVEQYDITKKWHNALGSFSLVNLDNYAMI